MLYEDSSLIWFRDRDRNDPEGGLFLKDAPEMLAAGQVNIAKLEVRGKKTLEQFSITPFFTGFENTAIFFPAI